MKLNREGSFKHFEGKEQIQMGLDLENTHSIMSLLRNNIYSDPIKSWVREIYSNAVDAHARVNNTSDAIDVEIKTQDGGYVFIVRDYGPSMNKETIANVYAKMGKSDKRSGNTEMGGWGLGAKSPLAYTDHFWIETYTQEDGTNVYRKWVQYIDPSRVGALSLLEEDTWTESKTGTRVTIPFDQKDLAAVKSALQYYLSYTDAKFNLVENKETEDIVIKRKWYSHFGSNWAMYIHEDSGSYWLNEKNAGLAVVGDIPYPINWKPLSSYFQNNMKDLWFIVDNLKPSYIETKEYNHKLYVGFINCLNFHEYEITLPIGSVDLNASREDLQYTDRTCRYMFEAFYKMFLEVYQFVRIDIVEHPNFPEACINYEKHYSGGFKKNFLKEVLWSKEKLHFGTNPPLFKTSPSGGYNSYQLDTVYSGGYNSSKKRDILRRDYNTTLHTGSKKYVIVIQDTDYTNFSKFVKYYAQKETDDKYNVEYLCVGPMDYDKIYDWIKETTPTVKLSNLVTDFKDNAPITAGNRAAKGSFKTLVYKTYNARPRADGIGSYFDYAEKDVDPDEECYYILDEQWNNPPDFFQKRTCSSTMNSVLQDYIKAKGIDKNNIVLTKKVTRNFSSDNWINLMDLIKDDYERHLNTYEELSLSMFTCVLVERQLPLFKVYYEGDIDHPDSMYLNLQKFYQDKKNFVDNNSDAMYFFNLINPLVRELNKYRASSYCNYLDKKSVDFMCDLQDKAYDIIMMYESYLKELPLLRFHDNYRVKDYDIEACDWVEYINLVEKEKNLYVKRSQAPEELEISEFSKLINKLHLQYL